MNLLASIFEWLARALDLLTDRPPLQAGLYGLATALAICPGYMYFLAVVSEWRWPTYADQFKAFMPGNLFLGVAAGGSCFLYASYRMYAPDTPAGHHPFWVWLPIVTACLLVAGMSVIDILGTFRHKAGDTDTYDWPQLISWTKLWHNVAVYGFYGYFVPAVMVPAVIFAPSGTLQLVPLLNRVATSASPLEWMLNDGIRVLVICCLAGWLMCLKHDAKHPKHATGHINVTPARWNVGFITVVITAWALSAL